MSRPTDKSLAEMITAVAEMNERRSRPTPKAATVPIAQFRHTWLAQLSREAQMGRDFSPFSSETGSKRYVLMRTLLSKGLTDWQP